MCGGATDGFLVRSKFCGTKDEPQEFTDIAGGALMPGGKDARPKWRQSQASRKAAQHQGIWGFPFTWIGHRKMVCGLQQGLRAD